VERVLGHLIGAECSLVCAARTDAGVHAHGQVAHLDLPHTSLENLSLRRLNRPLPPDVRIVACQPVPIDFDARFSALWRRYSYRICDDQVGPDPLQRHRTLGWPKPLDEGAMNQAAAGLIGEHDFASLCKRRPGASTIRELQVCRTTRDPDGILVLQVRADAFCHSMVRSLVGMLLPVGDGRRDPSWPAEVLVSGLRHPAAMVMPPHPLILEEVRYPAPEEFADRQLRTRRMRG